MCLHITRFENAIRPITTSAVPTDTPGMGKLPGCAAVVFGPDHKERPYGTDGWCDCGGTLVAPLPPTKTGLINCAITKQPTANSCPVNTAYNISLASATSASSANAKATPNPIVSGFACPTNAVVSEQTSNNLETLADAERRKLFQGSPVTPPWGCDMPNDAQNDAFAELICGKIPSNTVLSLGLGKQPFYTNSNISMATTDPNYLLAYFNMGFTVKDKCEEHLTKEYCSAMYQNIKKSCGRLDPKSGATWEGGLVTDNCGVAYFTSVLETTL